MRKCLFCNKEFEPNKNGARYKYCSEECYVEERRKRKRELWRKQNPDWNKKVVKKCEWCGDEYSVPKRNAHQARFCSDKCKRNYRKERRIKRNPDLNKEVIKKCEWCGGEYIALKINARQARFCSDKCRDTHYSRVIKGHKSREEYTKKRKIRALIRLIKDEINRRESLITKTCSECGKDFYTTNKQRKTCSKECSKKRENRRRWERERINNAVIDRDISLDKLYSRDKGICYICGGKCDFEDYEKKNGHFIAGPKYPSIDHVIPLSRGGKHAWDNVKLAHHRCNSRKSDELPNVLGLSVEIENAYAVAKRKTPNKKKVMKLTREGNIINVYESTAEASRQTGIKAKGIQKCARGECPTYGGFVWKYV